MSENLSFDVVALVFTIMVLLVPFALYKDTQYGKKFRAACEAEGGVVIHSYRSDRICQPKDNIIVIEVK